MVFRDTATWAEKARLKRKAEEAAKSEQLKALEAAQSLQCSYRGDYLGIEPGTRCEPPAYVFRCGVKANGKTTCILRLSTCVIVNGILMRKHSVCHECEFQV